MRSQFSSPRIRNVTSCLIDLTWQPPLPKINHNYFQQFKSHIFFFKNQISILTCVHCFLVPLEPLSPRIRNVTSRWIDLTWQPPSNADSLGNDLLGYRVYVEELCDHHTSHQYRRLRQREAAMAAAAAAKAAQAAAGLHSGLVL